MGRSAKGDHYHSGALKAWETRKRKGWKRPVKPSIQARKDFLLAEARKRLKGGSRRRAEKLLTHKFRSNSDSEALITYYEKRLGLR